MSTITSGRSFLPFLLALLPIGAGCGDDGGAGPDAAPAADATPNNPPNPLGEGPAPIDLGDDGDLTSPLSYVLLAKTGITNVTGSTITGGHVGLSPATAEAITGFTLVADPSTTFATSIAVVSPGRVYAANYTSPTPTNLTTAVLGMQAAYTDAASRTNPDELNLSDGNLGGLTLAPGLYRWGSTVTVPSAVTFSGGANDVWILQITGDLDVSAGVSTLLAGGALARNIYWQVAGQATLHADAQVVGVIIAQTGITLQTNATLTGRVLAQSLIALDDNDVTAP